MSKIGFHVVYKYILKNNQDNIQACTELSPEVVLYVLIKWGGVGHVLELISEMSVIQEHTATDIVQMFPGAPVNRGNKQKLKYNTKLCALDFSSKLWPVVLENFFSLRKVLHASSTSQQDQSIGLHLLKIIQLLSDHSWNIHTVFIARVPVLGNWY